MQGMSGTARGRRLRLVFHLTTITGRVDDSARCARLAGLGGERVASALDANALAAVEAIRFGDPLAGPLTLRTKIGRPGRKMPLLAQWQWFRARCSFASETESGTFC